jgi:hypothetical protein
MSMTILELMDHLTTEQIEAGLAHITDAPNNVGTLDLIVRRPQTDQREVLDAGELDLTVGLVGDNWIDRTSSRMPDGKAHPGMQLNIINSRLIAHICPDGSLRKWAGDQLHIDFNLSSENLPPWTKIQIGEAVIEITDQPHTGCSKFVQRFGRDAMRFVNSGVGKANGLRGLCARVVEAGTIRRGDQVKKL